MLAKKLFVTLIIPFLVIHGEIESETENNSFKNDETFEASVNHSQLYHRQKDIGIIFIEGGEIRGEKAEHAYLYRGIPYAEPPVGDLRFANPKRYTQTWNDIRDYSKFGPKCAQYDHFGYKFAGSEDCLTINVYVPNYVMKGSTLASVVVYIHGGAFMFGGSEYYGPENFVDNQRMILVTFNYRLGILGFLSTGDSVIPGNFGLKDQIEALRWVQRNIVAFKGDPRRVMLSGFSAGAASVHLHYMSPLTKGLFFNGISHSGTALDPWVMQEEAAKKASDVAIRFECHYDPNPDWLMFCLRKVPVDQLVMFATHFQYFMYNPFSPFGVVVEPASETAFLTDTPDNLLDQGLFLDRPWMLTETKDEGLYPAVEFINKETMATINNQWIDIAPYLLDYVSVIPDFQTQWIWSQKVRREYFKDDTINLMQFYKFRQVSHHVHQLLFFRLYVADDD
jgi:carboxylesterase type B